MDQSWLVYTGLTVAYIIILVIYFLRRSKSHEHELENFLQLAQQQLEDHKKQSARAADQKVAAALTVVKKVQQAAQTFEQHAQGQYDQLIEDAKQERQALINKAKSEVEQLFKQADSELSEYKNRRMQEIEKSLVKLVIAVTEKVVGETLSPTAHKKLIFEALEEIKSKQSRT